MSYYSPRDCPHCGKNIVWCGEWYHYTTNPECWQAYQAAVQDQLRYVCRTCGEPFQWKRYLPTGNCAPCAYRRAVKQNNQRGKANRAAARTTEAVCEHCSSTFQPARSDSRYCSNRCRQAAYRRRVTGGVIVTSCNQFITRNTVVIDVDLDKAGDE